MLHDTPPFGPTITKRIRSVLLATRATATADPPGDGPLRQHARRFFRAADRMLAQPGTHRT